MQHYEFDRIYMNIKLGLRYPRLPELRGINDVNNENVNKSIARGFVFCNLYRLNVSLPGQLFI